ncbi:unnamed protein product [Allacma fusca]|uniref:CCHC-type domain-containing protein n=1 Tax=Allacma fusca TaxID=39272 RepID=A0A8J2P4I8_9HEXA|nr:unnamed protein product [Allacma fusca]
MALSERKSHLQKKKGCFCCLKSGHMGKDCKLYVKCIVCSEKHYPIMCPEIHKKKEQSSTTKQDPNNSSKPSLANLSESPDVLLKTLIVRIRCGSKSRKARVVIDAGSHHSYILKSLAHDMEFQPTGMESLMHALFGGVTSGKVSHNLCKIPIANLEQSYECHITMMDQPTIYSSIPSIPYGPWVDELRSQKIVVSDVGSERRGVDILIGTGVAGGLMTGRIRHLKSGLVAIETKLGWTLMGTVHKSDKDEVASLIVSIFLNSEMCISNLRQLGVIGIHVPVEASSRKDLEKAAKDHFLKTVSINDEGRYEVHLPWIEGHPTVACIFMTAETRLNSTTTQLKTNNRLEDYHKVFEDWLASGVIEKIPDAEVESWGQYMPHRAVIKEHSATTKVRPVFDASAHEKNYASLNDCLEKGPNLIEKISIILIILNHLDFKSVRLGSFLISPRLSCKSALHQRIGTSYVFYGGAISNPRPLLITDIGG